MATECAYSKSTTRGPGHIAPLIDPAQNSFASFRMRGDYGLCCSRTGTFNRSCSGASSDSFQTTMTLASSICRVDE
jgi:hypothetical protein